MELPLPLDNSRLAGYFFLSRYLHSLPPGHPRKPTSHIDWLTIGVAPYGAHYHRRRLVLWGFKRLRRQRRTRPMKHQPRPSFPF